MSEQPKSGKKDQSGKREVLDELQEERRAGTTAPRYRDANRDQSRGDRDRTGRHTDEERTE